MAAPALSRRSSPRAPVALPCTLARRSGSPLACETVDVGGGGMRVKSARPLSVDETVRFSLALSESVLEGQARVLRMQGFNEYALRFEDLRADAAEILAEVLAA